MVQIIPRDALGGVEAAARAMASRADLECDFRLLLIAGESIAPGAGTIGSRFGRELNPLAQLAAARRIVRLEPDVLICSLWKSIPAALLAKYLRPSIRLVAFLHSVCTTHLLDRWLHALLIRRADAIWADSEATHRARVANGGTVPTRTISLVLDHLHPPERGGTRNAHFVSWGRLDPLKGVDHAIRLIAELVGRGVDARFDVWGPDNGELPRLQRLADELGVAERIAFLGPVQRSRLPEVAAGASFYLQLSRAEGMAMAVVEGMQLGLVPVVTAVGQMGHYCRNDENAVIVDPENLPAAADHLAALLADPAHYERLRRESLRRWAEARLYPDDVCAAARALIGGEAAGA